MILHVQVEEPVTPWTAGQFYLVRCTPSPDLWDPYLPRRLFPIGGHGCNLSLWLDAPEDRGVRWLINLPPGVAIDLIGPRGRGFDLANPAGNVLVLAEGLAIGALWPTIRAALDAGAQVLLAYAAGSAEEAILPSWLPPSVEYRLATTDGTAGVQGDIFTLLHGLERWPDQILAGIPPSAWLRLAAWIEQWRPRLTPGMAQMLSLTPIGCGYGACRRCAVERPEGHAIRSCVDGPVIDLYAWRRR